ncbi:hypothetical protein LUZ63_007768 [Rhynchospora breviuscula]|uniref:RPA-interacting protein C-terminal domain-containing protein n=1 Tax=Rhynchospora breviuscula TaxID=2022672 RepID=A0A9Q0CSI6_9POAL|nr:hypothetical protein LUZ63_007768 [Rhynchospora breviuscula]
MESTIGNATESEEELLEMERLHYKDIVEELNMRELEFQEEEEAYMAQQSFEHMQSNENQALQNKLRCPVCEKGDVHNLIYCTCCNMRLDIGDDKINLGFLRDRLVEVNNAHFDRGCKSTPKFCVETNGGTTALYIKCEVCSLYEVVF